MKILHLIDSAGLYGAEIMLLNLAAGQKTFGHDCAIASIGDKKDGQKAIAVAAENKGIPVVTFTMKPGPNIAGALRILSFAKDNNFDILHSHGYKSNILLGFFPKSFRKLPLVSTVHGWTTTDKWSKIAIYEWLDKRSLSLIDATVFVNKTAVESFAAANRGIRKKLHFIANGISPAADVPIMNNPTAQQIIEFCRHGFVIGAIGRLSKEKGFDLLIKAVRLLADKNFDIRCAIIGEGPERAYLENLILEYKLSDRILLPGYYGQAADFLTFFDVFVLSSLTEGLPITLLEAMQRKVPIVASAVGGIPSVLCNGTGGILAIPGSPEDLSSKISQVILNPDEACKRADFSFDQYLENYTSEMMTKKYLELYDQLISKRDD